MTFDELNITYIPTNSSKTETDKLVDLIEHLKNKLYNTLLWYAAAKKDLELFTHQDPGNTYEWRGLVEENSCPDDVEAYIKQLHYME